MRASSKVVAKNTEGADRDNAAVIGTRGVIVRVMIKDKGVDTSGTVVVEVAAVVEVVRVDMVTAETGIAAFRETGSNSSTNIFNLI